MPFVKRILASLKRFSSRAVFLTEAVGGDGFDPHQELNGFPPVVAPEEPGKKVKKPG